MAEKNDPWAEFREEFAAEARDWNDVCNQLRLAFRPVQHEVYASYRQWEQFCADMAPSAENRDWNDVRIELCLAFRTLRQKVDAAYREWEQAMEAQEDVQGEEEKNP